MDAFVDPTHDNVPPRGTPIPVIPPSVSAALDPASNRAAASYVASSVGNITKKAETLKTNYDRPIVPIGGKRRRTRRRKSKRRRSKKRNTYRK